LLAHEGNNQKDQPISSTTILGGNKSMTAPKLELKSSSKEKSSLPDDALVVRGGQSTAKTLKDNQANDSRGHISANSKAGVDLKTLATTPNPFVNGAISISTVGKIRGIKNDDGVPMDVKEDPTHKNKLHASIDPFNKKLSDNEADQLSASFTIEKNIWKE
jgi:hypothetical protein